MAAQVQHGCSSYDVEDCPLRSMTRQLISERMCDLRKSSSNNLFVALFAAATFLGSTGLSQAANSSGADIYKANCVSCHAADGHGSAVGKSLHAADFHSPQVQQQSDPQMMDVIKNGRGNMPPFGESLSQDQIAAVVKYIRTFKSAK